MATRFAGDIFSEPLYFSQGKSETPSYLTKYFPDLKNVSKPAAKGDGTSEPQGVAPFAGFKPMEKKTEYTAVEKFAGFKPTQ